MLNNRQKKGTVNFIKKYYWQLLISTVLVLAIFAAPLLTQARYKAFLNGFTAVIAKEYYFTSNYLRTKEASYLISGWDALTLDKVTALQIRNYDNALLTNEAGQDLDYTLTWKITTYDEEGNDVTDTYPYAVQMEYNLPETTGSKTIILGQQESQQSRAATEPVIEYDLSKDEEFKDKKTEQQKSSTTGRITSSIVGGESRYDEFIISIIQPIDTATDGYVELKLEAVNEDNQYSGKLLGTYRYHISLTKNLVRGFDIASIEEDQISATIKTDVISLGEDVEKIIHLWWDESKLEINWYNYFFNQLRDEERFVEHIKVGDRSFSELQITAVTTASNTFEFDILADFNATNNIAENVNFNLPQDEKNPLQETHYLGYYIEERKISNSGN